MPLWGRVSPVQVLDGLIMASGPPGAWFAIGIWKYEQKELCAPMTPITSGLRA